MAMCSGDRPFYREGEEGGKEERGRGEGETKREREERERQTRGQTRRQTDRHTEEVRARAAGAAQRDCEASSAEKGHRSIVITWAITTMSISLHWSSCAVKL